jgi:membrane fusion protein (multidrug efflux system)
MLRKTLQFVAALLGFALLVAGPLALVKGTQFKSMMAAGANMVMPPTVVTAATAKEESWPNSLSSTGTLDAVRGVTVAAETPGKVVKIAFESGALVKEGDLLVQLDTSIEEAQLRAAEATAALAEANLNRARELRQNNTNSPAELDAVSAQSKQAMAQAEAIRAIIAKKTIRAPFTGRLGLRAIDLGQILREGDAITTLQTLDPIYATFSLPQQRLSQIALGHTVRITSDAAPDHVFEGKITAISPVIDTVTRNIRVQATLANAEEKLRAGMFATIDVVLPTETRALAIPVTAVLYAPYGDTVFVIEEKKDEATGKVQQVIRQQFVRLGQARGDFVSVVDGLKPGDQIVSSGVFKLRPGMSVTIDNKLAPDAKLAPNPKNA